MKIVIRWGWTNGLWIRFQKRKHGLFWLKMASHRYIWNKLELANQIWNMKTIRCMWYRNTKHRRHVIWWLISLFQFTEGILQASWFLFTRQLGVLSQDLVNYWSHKIACWNYRIVSHFDRRHFQHVFDWLATVLPANQKPCWKIAATETF